MVLLSFINGNHDRWINGEDLKYEYVHFTNDDVRGLKIENLSDIHKIHNINIIYQPNFSYFVYGSCIYGLTTFQGKLNNHYKIWSA